MAKAKLSAHAAVDGHPHILRVIKKLQDDKQCYVRLERYERTFTRVDPSLLSIERRPTGAGRKVSFGDLEMLPLQNDQATPVKGFHHA